MALVSFVIQRVPSDMPNHLSALFRTLWFLYSHIFLISEFLWLLSPILCTVQNQSDEFSCSVLWNSITDNRSGQVYFALAWTRRIDKFMTRDKNFLKNIYYFMKLFFLNTCTYSSLTVKIWWGLNTFQARCTSIKSRCFVDLAEKFPTTHVLGISHRQRIQIF